MSDYRPPNYKGTRITLEQYNTVYSVELPFNDYGADELKEYFSRLLVLAGFSPSVLDTDGDGGSYRYVSDDEEVVKKKTDSSESVS